MKKIIALLLVLAMCFSLCACGKSEAVKNVEGLIEAIGEVTTESENAIIAAEEAYNALPEDEKEKVENYAVLTTAKDGLEILLFEQLEKSLVGEWVLLADGDTVILTLNEDGTTLIEGMEFEWKLEQDKSCIRLDGAIGLKFDINYIFEYIMIDNRELAGVMVRKADYKELSEKYITAVELTKENIHDYIGEPIYLGQAKDEWGDDMNDAVYCFASKAYENGLIYLGVSDDFAVENGVYFGLGRHSGLFGAFFVSGNERIEIGRVKGNVCFISSELVESVEYSDDALQRVVTLINGSEIVDYCRHYGFSSEPMMKYGAEAGINY